MKTSNYFSRILFYLALVLVCLYIQVDQSKAQFAVATATLDTNQALIGDQIRLTIEVKHPAGMHVFFPTVPDSIGGLEILSRSAIDTVKNDQKMSFTEKQSFVVTSFDSGLYAIPPFPFMVVTKSDTQLLQTEHLLLSVHTLKVDTTQVIRDIKSPLNVPLTWKDIMPYVLAGLALALIIGGIVYYLRRKKRPIEEEKKIPQRPAHEIALESLARLEEEKLWQQGKIKIYHSSLTDIVRTYIEGHFHIRAMEQTTDEIMNDFRSVSVDDNLKLKLKQTLELADFVKFAKVQPLPEDNKNSLDFAYSFVKITMTESKSEFNSEKKKDHSMENTNNQNSN